MSLRDPLRASEGQAPGWQQESRALVRNYALMSVCLATNHVSAKRVRSGRATGAATHHALRLRAAERTSQSVWRLLPPQACVVACLSLSVVRLGGALGNASNGAEQMRRHVTRDKHAAVFTRAPAQQIAARRPPPGGLYVVYTGTALAFATPVVRWLGVKVRLVAL